MSNLPDVVIHEDEPQRLAPGGGLAVRGMDDLARMAKVAAESGMFRDGKQPLTPQQAGVKMMFAMAMGFEPITGLTGVDLIEGNPSPNGHFWAAALESHPRYDYEVVESSSDRCTIRFLRDGGVRGEVTWTLEDAKRAGLAGKDNWRKYPRAMLYNRAMTEGGRMFCPQLFGGVRAYVPEELGSESAPLRVEVPAVSGPPVGEGAVTPAASSPKGSRRDHDSAAVADVSGGGESAAANPASEAESADLRQPGRVENTYIVDSHSNRWARFVSERETRLAGGGS